MAGDVTIGSHLSRDRLYFGAVAAGVARRADTSESDEGRPWQPCPAGPVGVWRRVPGLSDSTRRVWHGSPSRADCNPRCRLHDPGGNAAQMGCPSALTWAILRCLALIDLPASVAGR